MQQVPPPTDAARTQTRRLFRKYQQGAPLAELRGEHLRPMIAVLQERAGDSAAVEALLKLLEAAPPSGELLAGESEKIRAALAGQASEEVQSILRSMRSSGLAAAEAVSGFLSAARERTRLSKLLSQGGLPMHKLPEAAWQTLLGAARKVDLPPGPLFGTDDRVVFVWVLTEGSARATSGETFFPGHVIGAEQAVRESGSLSSDARLSRPAGFGVTVDPRRGSDQPVPAYMVPASVYTESVLVHAHYDVDEVQALRTPV